MDKSIKAKKTSKLQANNIETNDKALLIISRRRVRLYRLFSLILIPVLLLLFIEGFLRVVGYGYPSSYIIKTKFNGENCYRDNLKFSWTFFPPNIARESTPFIIPVKKPSNTYRIFILGESAAQGTPDYAYSFGRILEVMLKKRYPDINFEVVVTAVTAINSHVIRKIAADCEKCRPDLFIAYIGNNEVVGPYGPGTVFSGFGENMNFIRLGIWLKSFRIGQLASNISGMFSDQQKKLEQWGGMEMFSSKQIRHDDPKMNLVYDHFKANLTDIINFAAKSRSKMILCTVGSNLKDCPPFFSKLSDNLSQEQKLKWQQLFDQGVVFEKNNDFDKAVETYLSCEQIDSSYAELQYRLGRIFYQKGDYAKAKDYFINASEYDTLRFRADSAINKIITELADTSKSTDVSLVDIASAVEANSPNLITDRTYFYEHVHYNFSGNYLVAKNLLDKVSRLLPEPKDTKRVLTKEECVKYLAYTPWDDYNVKAKMLNEYFSKPPFTNWIYYNEFLEYLNKDVKAYRSSIKKIALQSNEDYKTAIADNPKDWWLYWKYSKLLLDGMGNLQAAKEQALNSMQYCDYYLTKAMLGGIYGNLNDYQTARKYALEVLKVKPNNAFAICNLGITYEIDGNHDKAIELYYKAIRCEPTYQLSWQCLTRVLQKLGRVDELEKTYRKAIKYLPDVEAIQYNLGTLLKDNGRIDEAEQAFQRALAIDPNSKDARKQLQEIRRIRKAGK
jgi:tetratricopeptide (TPR) repeat protein